MRKDAGLRRFCIAFLILDIAAAALLIFLFWGSLRGDGSSRDALAERIVSVENVESGEFDHALAIAAAEAASHVTMHSEVKSDGREIPLYLSNAGENTCSVSIEIVIPGTGELIARSGLVEPGWRLEKLPAEKRLGKGEYPCLVRCSFYTIDGNDFIGTTGKHILLTVS